MPETASPTLAESFAAAKEQHSAADPAKEQPASAATASDPEAAKPSQDSADSPGATNHAETPSVMSDAEFAAIQAAHPNDPQSAYKAMQGVFTRKLQDVAKTHGALKHWTGEIERYERDPHGWLSEQAQKHGLTLQRPNGQPDNVARAAESVSDLTLETFRQSLGPDMEGLAEPLFKAIQPIIQLAASKAVEPVKATADKLVEESTKREIAGTLDAFSKSHPGWEKYDAQMTALAQKFPNTMGVPHAEYLDHLYAVVSHEDRVASGVKTALDKMRKEAEKGAESTRTVPGQHVTSTAPANLTIREAFEAAKRGERFN